MKSEEGVVRHGLVSTLDRKMTERKMTGAELAKRSGYSIRTINKWRKGEVFSADGIEAALKSMGVTMGIRVEVETLSIPRMEGEQ